MVGRNNVPDEAVTGEKEWQPAPQRQEEPVGYCIIERAGETRCGIRELFERLFA